MGGRARLFVQVSGLIGISLLAGSSASADTATLKCNSQRDPIWVYDSLNSFNVDAKLKCGESVEIIARVQTYVKIRTGNGIEGYVPDAEFSNLPPAPLYRDSSHDVGMVAKQIQTKEIAKASANAAALAPASVSYSKISPASPSVIAIPAVNASEKNLSVSSAAAPMKATAPASPVATSAIAKNDSTEAPAAAPTASITVSSPATVRAPASKDSNRVTSSALPSPLTDGVSSGNSDLTPDRNLGDLHCQSYFSAYGLTPGQMKWIAQNREKMFSNICPAPDPSKVNFVIIFTHDVDFFGSSIPEAVHKDNGFSDFTPMTSIDTALIPESQADKARREYVWVFQFQKGTFDPGNFSPSRQYQYSKMETGSMGSKAGLKTVEDAFRFVASATR
jgi:hypothetical protein